MEGITPQKARRKQTPSPMTTETGTLAVDTTSRIIEVQLTSQTPSLLQKGMYLRARARRRRTTIRTGMPQKGTNQGQHTTGMTMIHMGVPTMIGMIMTMTVTESMMVYLSSCLHVSRVPYTHSSLVSDDDDSDYYY